MRGLGRADTIRSHGRLATRSPGNSSASIISSLASLQRGLSKSPTTAGYDSWNDPVLQHLVQKSSEGYLASSEYATIVTSPAGKAASTTHYSGEDPSWRRDFERTVERDGESSNESNLVRCIVVSRIHVPKLNDSEPSVWLVNSLGSKFSLRPSFYPFMVGRSWYLSTWQSWHLTSRHLKCLHMADGTWNKTTRTPMAMSVAIMDSTIDSTQNVVTTNKPRTIFPSILVD